MEIAFHIGVNATDEERLVRALWRSDARLASAGVALPGPGRYRRLLRETIESLGDSLPPEGTRDVLIDAITEMTQARRMVLSNPNFLSAPNRVFEGGRFYGTATGRMRALRRLFPEDSLSLFMAVRNPATFLPALLAEARQGTLAQYLGPLAPQSLAWSEVVERLRAGAPDIPITLWCNEDTPLLWNEILQLLSGIAGGGLMEGALDLVETIMSPEGFARMRSYLDSHPPATEVQLRRITGAFLDKYALPGEIEQEIDIPGWDEEMVEDLTLAYEADIDDIARMEGVTVLRP
ncbi:MAG: hypothetical protein IT542_13255 [Rubellimicrobium sp.]|nr:hypothetical protein [Rubellimicrobium sp.]